MGDEGERGDRGGQPFLPHLDFEFGAFGVFQLHGTILPSGKLDNASLQGRYLLKLRGKIAGDEGRGKWLGPQGECNGSFVLTRAARG